MTAAKTMILVVDDDEAVRESLKFALELEGLEVNLCSDGEDVFLHPALALAKCLVIDFKMPELDGIEVLQGLRSRGLNLPAILITGHATSALRQRAASAGALAVLQKPLIGTVLLDSIRQAVRAC
ncbi:response regulator [Aurantimonas sp. VKM B-3413]|uniref:response regulator n=1 Tax=Aurantimonas sp. VKM B-3413 TaxID=2779401 RepID=UPI001E4B20D7|nr:response regulator [Aurantimonas sp. VKM B-3413]MCB8838578.1 response regulator [Aurantimonas sp. VKM B-3413]